MNESALLQFQRKWKTLEVEVVGMATDPNDPESRTCAEGVDVPPDAWDAVVVGRGLRRGFKDPSNLDLFDLAEDVTKRAATAAALRAAEVLGIDPDDIEYR